MTTAKQCFHGICHSLALCLPQDLHEQVQMQECWCPINAQSFANVKAGALITRAVMTSDTLYWYHISTGQN